MPSAKVPSSEIPAADGWQPIGDGITSGISGIAIAARDGDTVDTLAVRDNKEPGQNRLVAVRYAPDAKPRVRPVAWAGEPPVDLEAIDAVPGRDDEYVALASSGKAYRIHRDGDTVHVAQEFSLPGASPDANYEGFALKAVHGTIAAVWADRGQDDRPAKLSAAEWNPRTNTFGEPDSAEFTVPYPADDVRHISDVKLSATGALTVSSASDPGDDGPYDSALYHAGRISVGGEVRLHVADGPRRLGTFPRHKIEALACLPGSREGILGTDDENDGGSIAAAEFCHP
ncbi:hypothetical protein FCH28_15485 [Streptomyces piniterrae]|uniref:Uncharacterized protein n=1 Tax=Streptomyces piniterrae TaxID=2571125 RepID=A0A4U0NK47_9ACTN|nr:hypothetical protein FCH28_15485 [Streptomyces piniterrae]